LDYQNAINDFVAKTRELQQYELSDDDWQAIELVTGWLKAFRSATTQMSTTKHPMLSSAHAIFQGLEESLQDDLANLPDSAPTKTWLALINAHRKLSDYFFKIDDSPYYVWASSEFCAAFGFILISNLVQVLDPCITYKGLRDDCDANDASTWSQIDLLKNNLHTLYKEDYAAMSFLQDSASSLSASTGHHANVSDGRNSPSKVNFMARYKKRSNVLVDEFEEYLKLLQEDFDLCDPIQWWAGRRAQFPNLSQLARDVLSIPGEYLLHVPGVCT
jgi:hypothetical protein